MVIAYNRDTSARRLAMFRLILILAAVLIVWKLAQVAMRQLQGRQAREQLPENDEFEPMQPCSTCGVHLPRSQADESGRCAQCRV